MRIQHATCALVGNGLNVDNSVGALILEHQHVTVVEIETDKVWGNITKQRLQEGVPSC